MRPFDTRLLREVPATRGPVVQLGLVGTLSGILAIGQALSIAALVVAVVRQQSVTMPAVCVLGVLIGRGVLNYVGEVIAARAGGAVSRALRTRALTEWLATPADSTRSVSSTTTLTTQSAAHVEPYVARYLPALISAAVIPPLAVIVLLVMDWMSALIVICTVPLLPVFAALIGMHTEAQSNRRMRESSLLAGHFLDVMKGLPTLVGYQRAEKQADQVETVGARHRLATMQTLRTAFLSSAALELLATISVAIVAVSVGLRLTNGSISLGVGLTAILLAPEAYWPIRRVGQEFHSAADGAVALDSFLATDEAKSTPSTTALCAGLSYAYPGTSRDVLAGVTIESGPGITAIVGPSGSGKSTLLDLIARLRTPIDGAVTDASVHYVTQTPYVASGTVRSNLSVGREVRFPSGSDWLPGPLQNLPLGLETPLGDDGFGLSAGQRALLALTRAELSDADVILLDEPTAHLDPEVRELFVDRLRTIALSRPVIVATHDAAVLAAADRQIELGAATGARTGTRWTTPPPRQVKSVPRRLKSAKPRRRSLIPAIVLGAASSMCGVALTATSGWLIVQASTRPVILTLLTAVVGVRAFGIGRPVLRYSERLLSHDVALGDLVQRRTQIYRALIPLTPARLGRRRRSDTLTAAVRDLDDVVDIKVRAIVPIAGGAIAMLAAAAIFSVIYVPAGLVIAGIALAATLVSVSCWQLERQRQRSTLVARAHVDDVATHISTNHLALQAISAQTSNLERLESAQDTLQHATKRLAVARGFGLGVAPVLTAVGTIAMAAVVSNALRHNAIEAPVAAMLLLGPVALGDLLGTLPDAMGALARGQAAQSRVSELTDQQPAIRKNDTVATADGHDIILDQVTAAWDGSHPKLGPVSASITPGAHIAVTGPNGSGKSTLLTALARQLEIHSGTYQFGDSDVTSVNTESTRRNIALMDAEPHIFAGTVRANLLLARPHARDDELLNALVTAGLAEWFAHLPAGLDTEIGADQRGVSGGERARIAMARAVLSKRPVMLLDEPVAHLDHPTAVSVMADVRAAAVGRTLIVVSHQTDALQGCDGTLELASKGSTMCDRAPVGIR